VVAGAVAAAARVQGGLGLRRGAGASSAALTRRPPPLPRPLAPSDGGVQGERRDAGGLLPAVPGAAHGWVPQRARRLHGAWWNQAERLGKLGASTRRRPLPTPDPTRIPHPPPQGKYTPDGPKPSGPRASIYASKIAEVQPLIEVMRAIGKERGGKTPAQVALNYTVCKGALPIPGAKSAKQVRCATRGAAVLASAVGRPQTPAPTHPAP
jgi:hypothetical protein